MADIISHVNTMKSTATQNYNSISMHPLATTGNWTPGVQELKQCRILVQKKHTSVTLLINSFVYHSHAFCIDQCIFYLQMPPVFSNYKKNFCLRV